MFGQIDISNTDDYDVNINFANLNEDRKFYVLKKNGDKLPKEDYVIRFKDDVDLSLWFSI